MKIKRLYPVLLLVFLLNGCDQPEISYTDHILDLPPMHEQFTEMFLIGNIFRGPSELTGTGASASINNPRLTRHYNAITAENHMKPSYLIIGHTNGTFTWNTDNRTTADNFITAAENANMKVIGHTLLWHSQNANWMWQQIAGQSGTAIASKEQALTIMKGYITEVASRYAGKIYSWDVLNEAFPDGSSNTNWKTAMRPNNPWFAAIGSDFVYEGFLAARRADPNAILYYNDYNTEQSGRRELIYNMVLEVNNRYLSSGDKPAGENQNRLLIEGIGMQEHHNLGVSVSNISATINRFRSLSFTGSTEKIILAVSELDIIAFDSYSGLTAAGGQGANFDLASQISNSALIVQGNRYRDYMRLYIANADIIERVSLWGVLDNHSWRSRGRPLLFDRNGMAKPAYYGFMEALN